MSIVEWIGGAASNTQAVSITPGGAITTGDDFKVTLTGEDDQPVTVTAEATATTVSQVAIDIKTALQASANALFTAVTWDSTATKVTGTAQVSGVPFYIATSASSTTTSVPTLSTATDTANSGPNDLNTDANYETSTGGARKATTGDQLKFNQGSYDALFGLVQTSVNLNGLHKGRGYTGTIGDPNNGYYLQIDCSNGSEPLALVDCHTGGIWVNGDLNTVAIIGTEQSQDAVRLDGDIDTLRVLGHQVRGKCWVADAAILDTVQMSDCPAGTLEVGENVTSLDTIEQTAGTIICRSGSSAGLTVNVANTGTKFIYHGSATGAVGTVNNRGGDIEYNGSGTLSNLNNYAGQTSLENSQALSVTITNATIWGGTFTDRSGLQNVSYTNDIIAHGGEVLLDSGYTVSKS